MVQWFNMISIFISNIYTKECCWKWNRGKNKIYFHFEKKKLQSFQENFSVPNVFFFHFIFKSILCTFNVPIGFFFLFSSIRISKCYKFCCRWAEYYSVLFIIKLNWRFFIKKKTFLHWTLKIINCLLTLNKK